jgi:hypothetical protein
VKLIASVEQGTMVGVRGEETRRVPLDPDMYELAKMFAGMSEG